METRSFRCCEGTARIVKWAMLEMPKGMWLTVHWWNQIPYAQSNFIQTVQSKQASKIRIVVQVNQRYEIPLHICKSTIRRETTKWRWPFLSSSYRGCYKVPNWTHGWQTKIRRVQHIFRPIVHIVYACDMAFEQKACDLHWYIDGK